MTDVTYQHLREEGAKVSAWLLLCVAFVTSAGLTVFGLNCLSRL